mmetsp:Transcript_4135/g.10528  ORF Transcript_4135/g.10528 Transcript_4135/m.10528 type:complete len:224 (+) Transcript_4135:2469-3140(+)
MAFSFCNQNVSSLLRTLNTTRLAITLHSGCCINCITKELEPCLLSSQHTSCGWPTMQTKPHGEIRSVSSQCFSKFQGKMVHSLKAHGGKAAHDHSMILLGLRQASGCNIAITNGFHLEDRLVSSNPVKFTKYSLQQLKHLGRRTLGAPGCESNQISQKNGGITVEIGNGHLLFNGRQMTTILCGDIISILDVGVFPVCTFLLELGLGGLFFVQFLSHGLRKER